jgi:hypothetical protein
MPSLRATFVPSVLLLVLACVDRPLDTSATGSSTTDTTDATTTTPPTSTTAPDPTSTSTSTSDPSTGSTTGTTADPVTSTTGTAGTSGTTGAPDGDCDLVAQDCPEGQKCMPVSLDGEYGNEAARCRPLVDAPDDLGERCEVLGASGDGLDTCPEGQFCWRPDLADESGTCLALCGGVPDDPACPAPEFACQPDPTGIARFCVRPCDPLAQDCPDAGVCVTNLNSSDGTFMCLDDASGAGGQLFAACDGLNTCDPGLHCGSSFMIDECGGDPEGQCCVPWCDLNAMPDPCPGDGMTCFAWSGQPAPGLEDVGLCIVPPR